MGPAWIAAPAALLLVLLADLCNRRCWGFLPDDPPGEGRKQHRRPMPLCGVVLLPLLVVPFLLRQGWAEAAAVLLCGGIGCLDDHQKERGGGVDWRVKAMALGTAAGLVAVAVAPASLTAPGWIVLLAVLAFVLINATNFLDNTDGVCAMLSGTSLLLLAGDCEPLWWAGFTALGFVPWNWPRPRGFVGDSGALALGACLAVAVVRRLEEPLPALGGAAVQLADFVQVVLARLWLGLPPWVGDRRHLTHILAHNVRLPRVLVAPVLALVAASVFGLLRLAA